MLMTPSFAGTDPAVQSAEARLSRVLERHFDPRDGSPYWLEREKTLGIRVLRDVRRLEDLRLLGPMDPEALRDRSVWDFVPRSLRADPTDLVVVETGGTLGRPQRTVFHGDDFHAAFVTPFLAAVEGRLEIPRGACWAWIGPGGPHAIGKAAREVCRALRSPDPFAVDFDPRWFKLQEEGSLARRRYLQHVLDQAGEIFAREPIEVLFSTPPVVAELGRRLPAAARERIALVHLGGLPVEEAAADRLKEAYPRAAFLSGYGNSLLGMCPQLDPDLRRPCYYPHGCRLHFRLVPPGAEPCAAPASVVEPGARGRVIVSRLDESFLILNLLERDTAARLPPPVGFGRRGFIQEGLGDPRPAAEVPAERLGIY